MPDDTIVFFLPTFNQTSRNILHISNEICKRREFTDERASSRNRARDTEHQASDFAEEIRRY